MHADHSLLEQILEQQPTTDAPLINTDGSISLNKIVADINRMSMVRDQTGEDEILDYQDQEFAVFEYNPRVWKERQEKTSQHPGFFPIYDQVYQSYARLFRFSGHKNCTIRVNGAAVARIYRSPSSGWMWETIKTPVAPQLPPQPQITKTSASSGVTSYHVGMVLLLAAIIFGAIVRLLP